MDQGPVALKPKLKYNEPKAQMDIMNPYDSISKNYCSDLYKASRRPSRVVRIGDVCIGGSYPILPQSMTTSATTDTQSTVDQIEKLFDVGCQLVRLTTPTMKDVENVPNIRAEMKRRSLSVPLVADVHFLPRVALAACDHFEKVRVNPGNFADKKVFEVKEYSEAEYAMEIERIAQSFVPIVRRAKENGVALRIGTNHGSLSDRIMNRFGDTPAGMVESAIEFIEIARAENFHDIVISMKSSNPLVMIQAYRLLVARMDQLDMDYPLHLGVTEAGEGQDGRIKSAMGIGSLLADGLGDTIRVSLTEDPHEEIPVARNLVESYPLPMRSEQNQNPNMWDPYVYQRRSVQELKLSEDISLGKTNTFRVVTAFEPSGAKIYASSTIQLDPEIESFSVPLSQAKDALHILPGSQKKATVFYRLSSDQGSHIDLESLVFDEISVQASRAWAQPEYAEKLIEQLRSRMLWIRVSHEEEISSAIEMAFAMEDRQKLGIEIFQHRMISLGRKVAVELEKRNLQVPIHLCYVGPKENQKEKDILMAASEMGSLLCDGIGDSVEIRTAHGFSFAHDVAFQILQAARLRMSKADYISCPSCGRTLFDLQTTTARIREKTKHLKGVKIAIMGCIVNGPGEMADADFGYVGSSPGKINLFVGKECVEKNIPQEIADQRLIDLIDQHGKWIAP